MDLASLKKKVLETKDTLISKGTKKLVNSEVVINTKEELADFIKKSQSKVFTSDKTGETKDFIKKVIILFAEKDSDFLQTALLQSVVFYTKSFSQNIPFKICDLSLADIKDLGITTQPSLALFETEKIIKIIEGAEEITDITKDMNLDILASIENA